MYTIYLVCSEIDNQKLYKIGYTKRTVEERIAEFKTGNCYSIYMVNSFFSKWGTKIESTLHRKYKIQNKNISGEWFRLDTSDVEKFYEDCQKIHSNLEIISNTNTYYQEKNKF